jgi:hypothetical protein
LPQIINTAKAASDGNPTTYPTPTELGVNKEVEPPEKIYAFDDVTYGFYSTTMSVQSAINPIAPQSNNVIGPTDNAVALGFSEHSNQVAYLINENNKINLWIGDIELTDVRLSWSDLDSLIGALSDYNQISLKWIVRDNFIIISNESNNILYSLADNSAFELSSSCNMIAKSPKTDHNAIWCPLASSSNKYIVLENDGKYLLTSLFPDKFTLANDWNISPSGDKILYANEENNIIIMDEDSNQILLPVKYISPRWDIPMRVFQWSGDESRILVYSQDKDKQFCSNNGPYDTCWLVFDSTGDLVWSPSGEYMFSDFDAALSNDGKWLASFMMVAPDRYGYYVSIDTNEAVQFSDNIATLVTWGK